MILVAWVRVPLIAPNEEDMEILQFLMIESITFLTQSLHIEIIGVGSRYDWLEIFRTVFGIIIGLLAVLGLESLIRIFRGK